MATNKNRKTATESGLYPIRTVSALTGVNTVTLRAWERRYGLIKPTRTGSGHRLYTRTDIDTIHRVVSLLDKGVAPSQVRRALAQTMESPGSADAGEPWAGYRVELIRAITQFDEDRVEQTYNGMLALYPMDLVTRHVLLPLLVELGTRWESAQGSVAEEHFFGVYLRNKLGARFHHRARTATGPKLLATCLPGEQHEIGLLLFALAAHDHGFRIVLLGADMPPAELPHAAHQAKCAAIVLSGSIDPSPALLTDQLPRMVADARVPVFIGGQTSVRRRDAITAAGALALGSDIPVGIRRIADKLGVSSP